MLPQKRGPWEAVGAPTLHSPMFCLESPGSRAALAASAPPPPPEGSSHDLGGPGGAQVSPGLSSGPL